MHKFHLFFLFITPSPFSMVATFLSSIFFVIYVNWAYLSDNPLIYQILFGPKGFNTIVWENTGSILEKLSQFFSSTSGYYLSLSALAIVVGIAVYTLLQVVSYAVTGTIRFFQRAELASGPVGLMELFIQLWIRSFALVGIVFFSATLVGAIIPRIETLIDTGASLLGAFQFTGMVQYAVALLLTAVSLHVVLVLIRLLLLRPRIFNRTLTD